MRQLAVPERGGITVELGQARAAVEGGTRGVRGMVGVIGRCAEQSDDGVADIFVDIAAMALDDIGHFGQVFIHQLHQVVRGHFLGDLRKTLDVGKEDRHVAVLAAELGQLVRS